MEKKGITRRDFMKASELPPQHHEVQFGLTHKVNFSYTPSEKRLLIKSNEDVFKSASRLAGGIGISVRGHVVPWPVL